MQPLVKIVEKKLLDDLGSLLTRTAQSGTFARGGRVPMTLTSTDISDDHITPIQVRRGASSKGQTLTCAKSDVSFQNSKVCSIHASGIVPAKMPREPRS